MLEQRLYDKIHEQGRTQAALARMLHPPVTRAAFHQMMTGYRGRRFNENYRFQLAVILGELVSELFPEAEDKPE